MPLTRTATVAVTVTAPPLAPPTRPAWGARIGWIVAAMALTLFAVASVVTMQSGMHGDTRTTNQHPGPAPYPPFLGVDNWPLVMSILAVALTIGLFGTAAWMSVRRRRVHWTVIIGVAAFFAGAVDPLANWATFTMFDPRVAHFPLSWPYFRISPLLEPTLSFLGGYAAYYVLTGIGLVRCYQRVVEPHLRTAAVGRLIAVFVTGFVLGLPLNALMQFLWLKAGMFFYTEGVGPVLHIAQIHLPVVMVVYDSLIFAMVAVLCVTDDDGRPVLIIKVAQRLPVRRNHQHLTAFRQIIIATALLLVVVLMPVGVLSALRAGGFARPVYDEFRYPAVKIYDPYGDLERAGKPGPFYR